MKIPTPSNAEKVAAFQRLLLPVWMQLSYAALAGEHIADETRLFSFMGGGGSDFTTVGDFRALMGDEREAVKASDPAP